MRFLIVFVLATSSLASYSAPAKVWALSHLAIRQHVLEWHGVALGATRRDVERRLKSRLAIAKNEDPLAGGSYFSSVTLSGTTATIQWSDSTATATVDSVHFPLSSSETPPDFRALVESLLSRHTDLELIDSRVDSPPAIDSALLAVRGHSDQAILLKGAPEHLVFISLDACLD